MARNHDLQRKVTTTLHTYIAYNRNTKQTEERTATYKFKEDGNDYKLKTLRNKVDIEACDIIKSIPIEKTYGIKMKDFLAISKKYSETDGPTRDPYANIKNYVAVVKYFDAKNPTEKEQFKDIDIPKEWNTKDKNKLWVRLMERENTPTFFITGVVKVKTVPEKRTFKLEDFIEKGWVLTDEELAESDDEIEEEEEEDATE